MANAIFNAAKGHIATNATWSNLGVILVDSTFSLDIDAQEDLADVSGDRITGSNGGDKTGITGAWTVDDANDRAELTLAAQTWSALGDPTPGTECGGAIVYDNNPASDADKTLLCFIDTVTGFSFPFTPNGSDFTLTFPSEGLIQLA